MSAGDGSGHRLGVETSSGEAGPLPQHDEAGWEARELQPTGLTEDGSFLLLVAADDRGTHFRVRADERLRGLTRGATGRPNPYQPRADSALTPREIQARLRAGQTASEVARAAGVPVERIQRYEAPVLAERGRVVEQAQAARPPVRAEEPRRPLGEIVAERLGQRGIPEDAVHWDASRRVDGAWTIQMTFPRDETTVTACWLWDPAVGRVRPHDDEAAAWLEPLTTRPAVPVMSARRLSAGAGRQPRRSRYAGRRRAAHDGSDGPRRRGRPRRPIACLRTGPCRPAGAGCCVRSRTADRRSSPPTVPWPAAPAATNAPPATPAASSTPTAAPTPGASPTAGCCARPASPLIAASPPRVDGQPDIRRGCQLSRQPDSAAAADPSREPHPGRQPHPGRGIDSFGSLPSLWRSASAGPLAPGNAPEATEPPTAPASEPPSAPASAATATPPAPEAVPLKLVPDALDPDDSGDGHGARGGLRADRRAGGDAPGPTEEVSRRSTAPRATGRRGRREVPAWDDIVFGAKGG